MKKQYEAPVSTELKLFLEGEIALTVTSSATGGETIDDKQDFLNNGKKPGGWNSELWSDSETE